MSELSANSIVRKTHLELVSEWGYFIYGAGGHAQVVEDFFDSSVVLACITDDWASSAMTPWIDMVFDPNEIPLKSQVIIAIGDNYARRNACDGLQKQGKNLIFPNVSHSTALISTRAGLGVGNMRCANSVVVAGTFVGDFCIINTGATVDHDCHLGDFSHIAPGVTLCGNVKVGAQTLVGVGSVARPNITIGADSIIGAGSVVVNDIPSGVIAHGNPCRVIKEIE